MRHVRAKFRCMSITKTWDKGTEVKLMAVTQSQHNEENSEFWKYTPSGEAKLSFRGPSVDDRGAEFTPGDYYYIDLAVNEEGGWRLSTVTYHSEENGQIELCTNGKTTVGFGKDPGFTYGKLDMGIDNPPAFLAFDKPGANWGVKFAWAEASDD